MNHGKLAHDYKLSESICFLIFLVETVPFDLIVSVSFMFDTLRYRPTVHLLTNKIDEMFVCCLCVVKLVQFEAAITRLLTSGES